MYFLYNKTYTFYHYHMDSNRFCLFFHLSFYELQPNVALLYYQYIHFYNNERIQLKTKLTPLEKRSQYVA